MRLSERLKQGSAQDARAAVASGAAAVMAGQRPEAAPSNDPLIQLKLRAQEALLERLGEGLFDESMTLPQLHALVIPELDKILKRETIPLSTDERQALAAAVMDDVLGYGPLEALLADDDVSEIMVNTYDTIYVERDGRLFESGSRFLSDAHLRNVIDRIVSGVGRRIDESTPMVDARLPDGSRVNAVVPPLAIDGPTMTIRKFAHRGYGIDDLIRLRTITVELAEFLAASVRGRANILVSGGTGTGKTTMLNALSAMIPGDERIITIEDAAELQLQQRHVVRLESRPPNIEGRGEVRARDLLRNALRMRPDRIIVGEVRGGEALDMLQAMNTGHDGGLSTLHANSPRDALARLETMVLMAGIELPVRAIREQVASALELIVQVTRMRDGSRRVTASARSKAWKVTRSPPPISSLSTTPPASTATATSRGRFVPLVFDPSSVSACTIWASTSRRASSRVSASPRGRTVRDAPRRTPVGSRPHRARSNPLAARRCRMSRRPRARVARRPHNRHRHALTRSPRGRFAPSFHWQ